MLDMETMRNELQKKCDELGARVVADACGVHHNTIRQILYGNNKNPKMSTIFAINVYLEGK